MSGEGQQAQMRLEHQQRLDALHIQLRAEEQAVKQAAEQESRWGAAAVDCWQRVRAVLSLLARVRTAHSLLADGLKRAKSAGGCSKPCKVCRQMASRSVQCAAAATGR